MAVRTIYLTSEGYGKLARELAELRTIRRPQVYEHIRHSRECGDTVDRAAGDEVRSEQAFVEGRIRDLELTLADAQIIGQPPGAEVVALGSRVTVSDDSGVREIYTIVGSIEADPRRGLISNESPVGKALLGKRAGESAAITAPGGRFVLVVVAIA